MCSASLEAERGAGQAALARLEQQRAEFSRLEAEAGQAGRERDQAVARLQQQLQQLDRLERERSEMLGRIENLSQNQVEKYL